MSRAIGRAGSDEHLVSFFGNQVRLSVRNRAIAGVTFLRARGPRVDSCAAMSRERLGAAILPYDYHKPTGKCDKI